MKLFIETTALNRMDKLGQLSTSFNGHKFEQLSEGVGDGPRKPGSADHGHKSRFDWMTELDGYTRSVCYKSPTRTLVPL